MCLGIETRRNRWWSQDTVGTAVRSLEMLPVDSRLNWVEVLCGRADGGTGEREVTVASISE